MWRPPIRNRDGVPVDPVPALVVVVTAFLVTFSWGPLYLGALGFSLEQSLIVLSVGFLLVSSVAVHRLIWTARPERRGELSPALRLERVRDAIVIGIALLVLLALPFLRPG